MLHTEEQPTCPLLDEPGNYHFEGRCEDCDIKTLARLNLGQVEERYQTGRTGQNQFEAYTYLWAALSPAGSRPAWRETPEDSDVRRIARKLLSARGLAVLPELIDVHPVELANPVSDEITQTAA